jgi:hypothetical protein
MQEKIYFDLGQKTLSLDAIVKGFEADAPIFTVRTWVRSSDGLYWTFLERNKDIALELHWDYIEKDTIHSRIKGRDLIHLLHIKDITPNTKVKLSYGFEWIKLKNTVLLQDSDFPFSGIHAHKPDWRNDLAGIIDFVIYLSVVGALLFLTKSIIALILSVLFCGALFEALCIHFLDATIGHKVASLYIVHANGTKLKFWQAFDRQMEFSPLWSRKRSQKETALTPFGAIEHDRRKGYVVTRHIPD